MSIESRSDVVAEVTDPSVLSTLNLGTQLEEGLELVLC
jgi:hypothetical protein